MIFFWKSSLLPASKMWTFAGFLVLYERKLKTFAFWTVGWTKQDIWRCQPGFWEIVVGFFHYYWHCLDQTINRLRKVFGRSVDNENDCKLQPCLVPCSMYKLKPVLVFWAYFALVIISCFFFFCINSLTLQSCVTLI